MGNGATHTGSYNTGVGAYTLDANSSGASNVAVGYAALSANTTASNNTAVGTSALAANTTGAQNTAVGQHAMGVNTTGTRNAAFGSAALDASNGSDNTAIGDYALSANTTGNENTALGSLSLDACTTGITNTALGYSALGATIDGGNNVAVGAHTAAGDCGDRNTAIGTSALYALTGDDCVAIGNAAGYANTSGDNNIFVGKDSGRTGSPGGNQTTGNGSICLGDENIGDAYIQVDWTVSSDERDKTDFTALDLGLNFVNALEPLTYKWDKRSKYGDKEADDYDLATQTPDGTHKEDWLDIGFKAQAVLALEEAAGYKIADKKNLTVSLTGDEKSYGLQYSKFVPILVKALQEADDKIDALTTRIEALES